MLPRAHDPFFKNIYLFINFKKFFFFCLHRVLVVAREVFRCGTRASLVVAVCRLLSSCGMRVFSSLGVACGLSCPAACGILLPQPGIELVSPVWEGGFFTTGPPGKSPLYPFLVRHFYLYMFVWKICKWEGNQQLLIYLIIRLFTKQVKIKAHVNTLG